MKCHFCKRQVDIEHESYWEFKSRALMPMDRVACTDCACEMRARRRDTSWEEQDAVHQD
jgi:hypothetical protein